MLDLPFLWIVIEGQATAKRPHEARGRIAGLETLEDAAVTSTWRCSKRLWRTRLPQGRCFGSHFSRAARFESNTNAEASADEMGALPSQWLNLRIRRNLVQCIDRRVCAKHLLRAAALPWGAAYVPKRALRRASLGYT
jgi:hypothetical protein